MKYKKIDKNQTRILVYPYFRKYERVGFIARPLAVVENYRNFCEAFGKTKEEAIACLDRVLEEEDYLIDYDVDNLTEKSFDKQIHMGGGNRSLLKRQLLHDKIDEACMIISGMEQNGGMGTEFSEEEDRQGKEMLAKIREDIMTALTL